MENYFTLLVVINTYCDKIYNNVVIVCFFKYGVKESG